MKLLVVITGQVDSGKTTKLNALCSRMDTLGLQIGGITQTVPIPGIKKNDYLISDLSTGIVKTLMSVHETPGWLRRGRFWIDSSVFDWDNDAIERTMATSDVLAFDEIGPIELEGWGMAKSFNQVIHSFNGIIITAIRSALLDQIATTFKLAIGKGIVADSTTSIEALYASVLQRLE